MADEKFEGSISVAPVGQTPATIMLNGTTADVTIGASERSGDAIFRNAAGEEIVRIGYLAPPPKRGSPPAEAPLGPPAPTAGGISIKRSDGQEVIQLKANTGTIRLGGSGVDGTLTVRDKAGNDVLVLKAGSGPSLVVLDADEKRLLHLDDAGAGPVGLYLGLHSSEGTGRAGVVAIRDEQGNDAVVLDAGTGDSVRVTDDKRQTVLKLDDSGSGAVGLYVGVHASEGTGRAGVVAIRDEQGNDAIVLDAGTGDSVRVTDDKRQTVLQLDDSGSGAVGLYVGVHSSEGTNRAGVVAVRDANGDDSVVVDGASGDIVLNNADIAEDFELLDCELCDPGTVVVIDRAGTLRRSETAYDRRVAGVVSGAGDLRPGIVLGRHNEPGGDRDGRNERQPIALTGKVLCKVDATYGSIAVGDLLTTSATAGHAMRVSDDSAGFGAVIGKALRPLDAGTGMVPILVALH